MGRYCAVNDFIPSKSSIIVAVVVVADIADIAVTYRPYGLFQMLLIKNTTLNGKNLHNIFAMHTACV